MNNTGTIQAQSGTLNLSGAVTQFSGNTLTGGTWLVSGSSTLAIPSGGNITTNQGSVTLDGPGSTFANINSLTNNQGTFTITDGQNFTTVGALANSGTINVGNGSTLVVSGNLNQTTGNLWLDNAGTLTAGTVAIAGGSLSAGGPNANIIASVLYSSPASSTFQGQISGSGNSLVLSNSASVLVLSGSNSYTGGTTLAAGVLSIGNDSNIGGAGSTINFNGGMLQVTGISLANLDSHTVNWGSFNGGIDVNNAANTFTISQSIGGSGGLTKAGAGTLVLDWQQHLHGRHDARRRRAEHRH